MSVEKYLKPEVIRTIKRLDLRAQFIVRGFMHGLHSSNMHGFSVEFSEHRKYSPGDDPSDIDWLIYAKTDKYYIRKYEAETNLTCLLVVDASRSMGYTFRQNMTKFDYAVSLSAAMAYLMIHQQDPVGLITFAESVTKVIPPKSKRNQFGIILSELAKLQPIGTTNIAAALTQTSALLKHSGLVAVFSDLLSDQEEIIKSLHRLRHAGHDVILFHILDEAEVKFPFSGRVEFEEPETLQRLIGSADAMKEDYLASIEEFRAKYRSECARAKIDYIELDTSMQFDKALTEYLIRRSRR